MALSLRALTYSNKHLAAQLRDARRLTAAVVRSPVNRSGRCTDRPRLRPPRDRLLPPLPRPYRRADPIPLNDPGGLNWVRCAAPVLREGPAVAGGVISGDDSGRHGPS